MYIYICQNWYVIGVVHIRNCLCWISVASVKTFYFIKSIVVFFH